MKLTRIHLFELLFLLVVIAVGAKLMQPKPKVVEVPALRLIQQAYEQKHFSECESLCRSQLLVEPDDLVVSRWLGMSLREQNRDGEAKQIFDVTISRSSTVSDPLGFADMFGVTHNRLANLHRERGHLLRKTTGWSASAVDYCESVKLLQQDGSFVPGELLNWAGLATYASSKSPEAARVYFEYADHRALPERNDSALGIHLKRCTSTGSTAKCDLSDCPLCLTQK
jgi:hypothetical protein